MCLLLDSKLSICFIIKVKFGVNFFCLFASNDFLLLFYSGKYFCPSAFFFWNLQEDVSVHFSLNTSVPYGELLSEHPSLRVSEDSWLIEYLIRKIISYYKHKFETTTKDFSLLK